METHKCRKDEKYIISTNSDCVVTDVETGITLAVVLAKTQKVIVTISNSFTTSVECSVRPFVEATSDIDLIGGGEDYLPAGYKRIEYLEASGTQYINTGVHPPCVATISFAWLSGAHQWCLWGVESAYANGRGSKWGVARRNDADVIYMYAVGYFESNPLVSGQKNEMIHGLYERTFSFTFNGATISHGIISYDNLNPTNAYRLFAGGTESHRLYTATITDAAGNPLGHFVPVLDDTGTPCMFDKVSHQSYYNSGSGDFIYPVDEYDTQTLDLDDVVYGKMTEYGIRRLYKVPAGETVTLTDYALANGYKEIIEPPMPREGYWVSQWKETDTQLILEWVETEAPSEEV